MQIVVLSKNNQRDDNCIYDDSLGGILLLVTIHLQFIKIEIRQTSKPLKCSFLSGWIKF